MYFLEYALFLRRGNKVLIQKIKIICGYNTGLVKNEARNFPKTNKGVILIWHTQDAFEVFRILFYISQTKKMTYVHYCRISMSYELTQKELFLNDLFKLPKVV